MSDSDDIAAQIRQLEKQSAAQAESRQKNASSADSKRRQVQVCARGCHHWKDDPDYLKPTSNDKGAKKKKSRKAASKVKLKHVCPGPCKSAAKCPQKENIEVHKRLHAPEHAIARLKLRKKKLKEVCLRLRC
jgi:hypothetical protein